MKQIPFLISTNCYYELIKYDVNKRAEVAGKREHKVDGVEYAALKYKEYLKFDIDKIKIINKINRCVYNTSHLPTDIYYDDYKESNEIIDHALELGKAVDCKQYTFHDHPKHNYSYLLDRFKKYKTNVENFDEIKIKNINDTKIKELDSNIISLLNTYPKLGLTLDLEHKKNNLIPFCKKDIIKNRVNEFHWSNPSIPFNHDGGNSRRRRRKLNIIGELNESRQINKIPIVMEIGLLPPEVVKKMGYNVERYIMRSEVYKLMGDLSDYNSFFVY